jgi:NADH-quinone oxidoreductase subunit N
VELDIKFLIPEVILLAAACICTLMGLSSKDSVRRLTQGLAALACLAAFVAAITDNFGLASLRNYLDLSPNRFALPFNPNYISLLAAIIGFLSILAAWDMPSKSDPATTESNNRGEFFGMLLFSLAGVSMIGKVNDLIWLFIVLELVSIPTYIMVATGRSQIIAQEAGIKYFFLGALAAAIFLFGFSYIYGATGFTRFEQIHAWFANDAHPITPLAMIGFIMVLIGVGYKIAAWPLHFYAPDVYQGAATPVTAFLAFAPKTAGIVAIISVLNMLNFEFVGVGAAIGASVAVIAAVTMTVGNVMALLQRNIKRIFAYSSIAHSGYMLVGLVSMDKTVAAGDGVTATIFYLTSYAIMNLGAFAALIYLQGKADAAEDIDDIAGVAKTHPIAALMMTLCLFSLIGMPLTVGFLGKFYLVSRALSTGHQVLAVIVMINAAIAAAYYLKIVAAMYLREALYPFTVRNLVPIKAAAVVCTLAVVVFFVVPNVLILANNTELPAPTPTKTSQDMPKSSVTPALQP